MAWNLEIGAAVGRDGRYRVEALVGEGGFGIVYRAWDAKLDRAVALKTIAPSRWRDPKDRARFTREARLMATVEHPKLVRIYDVDEGEHAPFLVMEFLEGRDLSTCLDDPGAMEADEARRLARDLASALACLHGHDVLHRDIKPANVFRSAHGGYRLTDFGLARPLAETRVTDDGEIIGTLLYYPPELFRGEEFTKAGDVYQVGLVLHRLAAGEHLYGPIDDPRRLFASLQAPEFRPPEIATAVPDDLAAVIDACCRTAPTARLADGAALETFLEKTLGREGVGRPRRGGAGRGEERRGRRRRRSKRRRRSRLRRAALWVALFLVVLVAAGGLRYGAPSTDRGTGNASALSPAVQQRHKPRHDDAFVLAGRREITLCWRAATPARTWRLETAGAADRKVSPSRAGPWLVATVPREVSQRPTTLRLARKTGDVWRRGDSLQVAPPPSGKNERLGIQLHALVPFDLRKAPVAAFPVDVVYDFDGAAATASLDELFDRGLGHLYLFFNPTYTHLHRLQGLLRRTRAAGVTTHLMTLPATTVIDVVAEARIRLALPPIDGPKLRTTFLSRLVRDAPAATLAALAGRIADLFRRHASTVVVDLPRLDLRRGDWEEKLDALMAAGLWAPGVALPLRGEPRWKEEHATLLQTVRRASARARIGATPPTELFLEWVRIRRSSLALDVTTKLFIDGDVVLSLRSTLAEKASTETVAERLGPMVEAVFLALATGHERVVPILPPAHIQEPAVAALLDATIRLLLDLTDGCRFREPAPVGQRAPATGAPPRALAFDTTRGRLVAVLAAREPVGTEEGPRQVALRCRAGPVRVLRLVPRRLRWEEEWQASTGTLRLRYEGSPILVEIPAPLRDLTPGRSG